MLLPLRLKFIILLLALASIGFAQDGVSTAGAARTRYLGNLGIIPASREVVVEDFVNYHRHEIARPKAGEAVALDLRWGSETVSRGHDAVLQIGISTALAHDREQLRPLNLALVIDKSGSMADANKLVRVKQALLTLVPKLRSSDVLSIVVFDTTAEVLLPAEPVGDGERAKEIIRGIEPGSSTNLNSGLMLGYKEDLKHFRKGSTNRVILLTDGIANQGEVDPAKIAQNSLGFNDRGIDLSTIGVGLDLNKNLLRDLAKSGRGLFHFVADAQDIQKVFEKEVQSLLSPVATEPNLEIEYGSEFRLDKIYGYEPKMSDGSARIKLDNMNSGMTEVVLLKLRPMGEGSKLPVKVRLSYYDLERGKEVVKTQTASIAFGERHGDALQDDSVAKNYTIATIAQAMHDMAADCEGQRYVDAENVLNAAISNAYERYPSLEDEDISRTVTMAVKYQSVLRTQNGDRNLDRNLDRPMPTLDRVTKHPNLISNGDFALGNCGFTSGLGFTPATDNCLWPGGYTIAPTFMNPKLHSLIASQDFAAPKQTTGNEQVFFANAGGGQLLAVWSAQVKCKPNTRYRISFQTISLTPGVEWIPTYEIRVNSFRSEPQASSEGSYTGISTEWESGDQTTATVSIMRMPIPHGGGIIGIANIEMVEIPRVRGHL